MGAAVSLTDQSNKYVSIRGSVADPDVTRSIGASTIGTNQGSATTTSAQAIPARAGRQSVTLVNESTTVIRYGAAGVSTATGAYLAGVVGASVTINTAAAVHAVVATGTAAFSYVEVY